MRNWEKFWTAKTHTSTESESDLLVQVGKTRFGVPVPQEQVQILSSHILKNIALTTEDRVLDLGCGNGILSKELSVSCRHVTGVDFSGNLLKTATQKSSSSNIDYVKADLAKLGSVGFENGPYSAAFCSEVIQNLDEEMFLEMLKGLHTHRHGEMRLLISGIPDLDRIRNFYDTDERWSWYLSKILEGGDHIGRWWTKQQVLSIIEKSGFIGRVIAQPNTLYTAHYRFDVLALTSGYETRE